MEQELKKARSLVGHMLGIRSKREAEWRNLARWICGFRGVFDGTRPDPWDEITLFRGVASHALQRGASGMTSGMTPRNISWFRSCFGEDQLEELSGAREWLDEIDRRIGSCLSEGGFYQAIQHFNTDLIWAGCALLYAEAGRIAPLRYECCQIGSFCVALDNDGQLAAVARLLNMTVSQAAEEFGQDQLSESARRLLKDQPHECLRVWHLARKAASGRFPVSSEWYEETGSNFLRRSGYEEMPYFFTCWHEGLTPYGTGPGDAAIADARQLDELERTKLAGLQKLVNPPLVANSDLKEAIDLDAGALNFVGIGQELKPIFDLAPYTHAMPNVLEEIRNVSIRLDNTLLASIFSSMPLDQRPRDMSATEFLERKREVLQQIGPVISAYEPNVLAPLLWRTANTLERNGLTPPPPDSLAGIQVFLQMQFISPMANALRATDADAVRALIQDTAQLAAATQNPLVFDKLDADQCIDEIARGLGAPGSVVRSDADVEMLRQQRQAAMRETQPGDAAAEPATGE